MSERRPTPPEAIVQQEELDFQKSIETNEKLSRAFHLLSPEYLVYSDWQEQQGEKNLLADKEFLEFIKNLNPAFIELFNHLLEQNLEKAYKEKKTDIKDQIEIFAEYEKNLENLKNNYSLPLTDEEAIIAIATTKENQKIDCLEAKKLGLEASVIRGSIAAARLLQEVANKTIDITTKKGQKDFVDQWKKECPNLPMPKSGDFWYLKQLAQNRIISNVEDRETNESATPHFDEDEILFVDNWKEENYNSPDAPSSHRSELLKELLGNPSTVNISRETLDQALWTGDPAIRQPTKQHQKILKILGCDPKEFEFRLIRQDEYARLAPTKGYGQKNLWTNFDNYFLGDVGARNGLDGGNRGSGGASGVDCTWRDRAADGLSVRLVLSRKQGKD